MKKTFLFSLGLILALSALFVSCKDEPDNNKEENSGISCEINIIASEGGYVQFSDYFGNSKHVYTGSKVTIIATPDEGYAFIGWYVVGNNEKLVSNTASYTFTTQGDLQLLAKFESKNNINGHEYVDLGLPSGLKWATCNVGANSPEEYGGYYAWGETEEKSSYGWSTYKWCNGSYNTMTKYCTDRYDGTVDNKTVLDPGDDVAHVKWGGSWRMPTKAEQDELRNKCSWTWTAQNGVNGYRVTGPNGNSIFLPAVGYRSGTSVYIGGYDGFYWSSSLSSNFSLYACLLDFYDDSYLNESNKSLRSYGFSVRPVTE